MSELRAPAPALRLPPTYTAVVVGTVVAAVVVAVLLRPMAGLYVTEAVALVAGVVVAGATLFTSLVNLERVRSALCDLLVPAAVVAFAAALLTLPFAVMVVSGDGIRGLGEGLARADVLRSGSYETVVARGAGAILVVGGLRLARDRDRGRFVAGGGAVVLAGSFLLTGHFRSHAPTAAVVAAGLAHVLAASAWLGGLVALGVALHRTAGDRAATTGLLVTFARLMRLVLTLLLAGGVGLAVLYLKSPGMLVHSTYGQVLLLKVGLVAALLIVSTANHLRFVPLAARGSRSAVRVLRTNIAVEQLILTAVLVITAVLSRQNPGG